MSMMGFFENCRYDWLGVTLEFLAKSSLPVVLLGVFSQSVLISVLGCEHGFLSSLEALRKLISLGTYDFGVLCEST